MLSRREMLRMGLLSVPAFRYGFGSNRPARLFAAAQGGTSTQSCGPFTCDLQFPPVVPLSPSPPSLNPPLPTFKDDIDTVYATLAIEEGFKQILPTGPATRIWGYTIVDPANVANVSTEAKGMYPLPQH